MTVKIGDQIGYVYDNFRYYLEQKVDIPAGSFRKMDVVAQFDTEAECYGWSNEAYRNLNWRYARRKIVPGTYQVIVTIYHLGGTATFSCKLENLNPAASILQRLES